ELGRQTSDRSSRQDLLGRRQGRRLDESGFGHLLRRSEGFFLVRHAMRHFVFALIALSACDNSQPSAGPEPPRSNPTMAAPVGSAAAGVDPGAVEKATGIKPEVS